MKVNQPSFWFKTGAVIIPLVFFLIIFLFSAATVQGQTSNPGFESGTIPWVFYINTATGSFLNDAPGSGSAHAGHITISQPGSNVQLYQANMALEPNTQYRLSFKAYSNTGHDLSVSIFKNSSPYTSYGLSGYVANLTPSWNSFSVDFTASGFSGTVNDGRLMFWLAPYATAGDQYFFDDIVLEKVVISATPTPTPTPIEFPDIIVPSVPANLSAAAVSSSQVNLSWAASTDNVGVAGYKIYRGGKILKNIGNQTAYSDFGLTADTIYEYSVSAYDAAGNESGESSYAWPKLDMIVFVSPQYSSDSKISSALDAYTQAVYGDIGWKTGLIKLDPAKNTVGNIRNLIKNSFLKNGIKAVFIIGEDTKTQLFVEVGQEDDATTLLWQVLTNKLYYLYSDFPGGTPPDLWISPDSSAEEIDALLIPSNGRHLLYLNGPPNVFKPDVFVSLLYPVSQDDYQTKVNKMVQALNRFSGNRKRIYNDNIQMFDYLFPSDHTDIQALQTFGNLGRATNCNPCNFDTNSEYKLFIASGHANPAIIQVSPYSNSISGETIGRLKTPFFIGQGCDVGGWFSELNPNGILDPILRGNYGQIHLEQLLNSADLRIMMLGEPEQVGQSGFFSALKAEKTITEAYLSQAWWLRHKFYGDPTFHYNSFNLPGLTTNPGFESGTIPWVFYINTATGSFLNDAPGSGSAHAGHITISQPGSNVQLYQANMALEPKTQYRLSFKAYSNTGHDLSVSLQKHGSPYSNYGLSSSLFNLTNTWNDYSVQFTTSGFSGTVNDGRLMFWLAPYATAGDQYFFDDIVLEKVVISGPPVITTQPSSQTVEEGQTATFSITAASGLPLSYQWQKNGVNIPGATNASYITPTTTSADNGAVFTGIVSNSASSVTSNPAMLTVITNTPPIPFTSVTIDANNPINPHGKAAGDINGDGFADVLAAGSAGSDGIYWYEYPNWNKHLIATGAFTTDMQVGDIDSDGDLDAVIPNESGIIWYKNPRPLGNPTIDAWQSFNIGADGANNHDVELADMNNDTKLDVVTRPKNGGATNVWLQNDSTSWTRVIASARAGEGTSLGDIDDDGDIDIAHNSFWLENLGGGLSWVEHNIDVNWPLDVGVHIVDINQDGRNDMVLAPSENSDGRLSWYESANPRAGSWTEHVIDSTVSHVHTFKSADMDKDGDVDLVTAEMHQSANDEVSVWRNNGGGLSWTQQIIANTGSHNLRLADIGNDGDVDIIGANWNDAAPDSAVIRFWQNDLNSKLTLDSWQRHVIDPAKPTHTIFVASADFDGDNLKDIVTGGLWYRNPGSNGGVWEKKNIGATFNNLAVLHDFDSDGDIDIFGTQGMGAEANANFVWAENDGAGNFTIRNNIQAGSGDFLQGVGVGKFNLSDANERIVLSWHIENQGIQTLTVPASPSTEIWPWQEISAVSQDEDLSVGDIDGDGDSDLLMGTKWLRNDNGSWTAFTLNLTSESPDRNELADINKDGRLDSVVGFEAISIPGKLAWYEQPVPPTDIWTEHIIATVIGPMSLDAKDMDNDGDADIVVGEHNLLNPASAKLYVFENLDGIGTNWVQHIVYTGDEHHDGAQVVDIDSDGDLDIISIGWENGKTLLYENKAITAPDVLPPAVSITSPSASQEVSGVVAISATAADDVGVVGVQFKLDGQNLGFEDITSPYSIGWGTSQASNGSHSIAALARDAAGNQTLSSVVIFSVSNVVSDATPPLVSISHSPANPTTEQQVALTATASDLSGIKEIKIYVDGVNAKVCAASPCVTAAAAYPLGSHTYYATAADNSSNSNVNADPPAGTKSFIVSQPPPASIVYDDFASASLGSIWSWTDPLANSQYSLTANPGHLQITVPAGSTHDCWTGTSNCARMLGDVGNIDAVYETKIDGININTSAQTYGIMLYQNDSNYIRFEFWTMASGVKATAWKVIGGVGSGALPLSPVTLGSSNYLRVTRTGNTYKLEYSVNGSIWTTVGAVTQTLTVNKAGPVVINAATNPLTTGNFDYFSVK